MDAGPGAGGVIAPRKRRTPVDLSEEARRLLGTTGPD